MFKAKGTLQTTFYKLIPGLFFFSKSRITNGKNVDNADNERTTGRVYAFHILPIFAICFINPIKGKKV